MSNEREIKVGRPRRPPEDDLLTPAEAAAYFGFHRSSIYSWVKLGLLHKWKKRVKPRRGYLVSKSEIAALIKKADDARALRLTGSTTGSDAGSDAGSKSDTATPS